MELIYYPLPVHRLLFHLKSSKSTSLGLVSRHPFSPKSWEHITQRSSTQLSLLFQIQGILQHRKLGLPRLSGTQFSSCKRLPVYGPWLACQQFLREIKIKQSIQSLMRHLTISYKLLFLGHRSLIKKITQTVVINIVFKRIFYITWRFVCQSTYIFKRGRYNFWNLYIYYKEGREGVKWELGFAFFRGWDCGIWAGIWKKQFSGKWD